METSSEIGVASCAGCELDRFKLHSQYSGLRRVINVRSRGACCRIITNYGCNRIKRPNPGGDNHNQLDLSAHQPDGIFEFGFGMAHEIPGGLQR